MRFTPAIRKFRKKSFWKILPTQENNRNSYAILLLLLIFSVKSGIAQLDPPYKEFITVASPSVNNNFLKFGSTSNVNLYTGTLNTQVDILTFKAQTIEVPIKLNYISSNGIKVQDVANFVGLGWRITNGGCITRTVRVLPDEFDNGYIGKNRIGDRIAEAASENTIRQVSTGNWDGQPDIFTIMTPWFNVRFYFDKDGNAVFDKNPGFKITHALTRANAPYTTSWRIVDNRGYTYIFGGSELSREQMRTKLYDGEKTFTTAWYLDEVYDVHSIRQLEFKYQEGPDYTYKRYARRYERQLNAQFCSIKSSEITEEIPYTFIKPKYLSTITTREGQVKFTYGTNRSDVLNAYYLNGIELYGKKFMETEIALIKKYAFSYSYFGAPSTNNEELRLRLDNIKVYNPSGSKWTLVNEFIYNSYSSLPARNSVKFDYLGYFNNNTSGMTTMPWADRTPDYQKTMANILTGVRDASGRLTNYYYEQNTVFNATTNSNETVPGLRIASTEVWDGFRYLSTQYKYEYDGPSHKSTGQVGSQKYKSFGTKWLFISPISDILWCVLECEHVSSQSQEDNADMYGTFIGYSLVKTINPDGGSTVEQFTNFSDHPDDMPNYQIWQPAGTSYSLASYTMPGPNTSLAGRRGKIKTKATYNSTNDILTEVTHHYRPPLFSTVRCPAMTAIAIEYNGSHTVSWLYGYSNTVTEDVVEDYIIERLYETKEKYMDKRTDYVYWPTAPILLYKEKTTDSKGNLIEKQYHYSGTYTNQPVYESNETAAIEKLRYLNNLTELIHTSEKINDQEEKIQHTSFMINYDLYEFERVVPYRIRSGYPDKKLYIEDEFHYTPWDYANVVERINKKSPAKAYLPERQFKNIIAIADNATFNDIAYTSFESQYEAGNWIFSNTGTSNIVTADAITGERVWNLYATGEDGIGKHNLTANKTYRLLLWYKYNEPVFDYITIVKKQILKTKGEWKLLEVIFTGSTIMTMNSATPCLIDEMRMCPIDAQMTTYCNLDQIGIGASSDHNGKISTFKYDYLGNLINIIDEDGNIVKQFRYNIINQSRN